MKIAAAIPARIGSTRFPGKVLADINGKPMLWHVFQGVAESLIVDDIIVLTDSQLIVDLVDSWGGKSFMTSEECPSGTDRIASVIDSIDAEIIVNVQGDEPLIKGFVIDVMVEALKADSADVATPVYRLNNIEDVKNPNIVKVVRASDNRALYFSRSPVPYVRDVEFDNWTDRFQYWGHVGLYAFRRKVISEYVGMPKGKLEEAEKLEQLRLLEAGKRIIAVEIDYRPHAVDLPEDLEYVKMELTARERN